MLPMRKWLHQLAAVAVLMVLGPLAATAQEEASLPRSDVSPWGLSVRLGITDLASDIDAPGSLSTVAIERRLTERFSLGLEAGLGSITRSGRCTVGTEIEFGCDKASWWPSASVGTRLHLFEFGGAQLRHYLLAQFGAHGPDLVRFYDLGQGLEIQALGDFSVVVELRHRRGVADGMVYFFGLSRPLGGSNEAEK